MMAYPSKRELELRKQIEGWRYFDPSSDEFKIRDDAPEEVKRAFEELNHMK